MMPLMGSCLLELAARAGNRLEVRMPVTIRMPVTRYILPFGGLLEILVQSASVQRAARLILLLLILPLINISVANRSLADIAAEEVSCVTPHQTGALAEKLGAFGLNFKQETGNREIMFMTLMPGEQTTVSVDTREPKTDYTAEATGGELKQTAPGVWKYLATSKPGHQTITVRSLKNSSAKTLEVFTLTPFEAGRDEKLNGYPIGFYEAKALRNDPQYSPPSGLIEVTPANEKVKISPNFRLGDFLCHQASGYPKYLLVKERLVLKLEMLRDEFIAGGVPIKTMKVMSGYRTPAYNRSIGNSTVYSAHLFGGAADIYVDNDSDGSMDDLNNDRRVDAEDAEVLAGIIDKLVSQCYYKPFFGGISVYKPRPGVRGPFLHVDVRGRNTRW